MTGRAVHAATAAATPAAASAPRGASEPPAMQRAILRGRVSAKGARRGPPRRRGGRDRAQRRLHAAGGALRRRPGRRRPDGQAHQRGTRLPRLLLRPELPAGPRGLPGRAADVAARPDRSRAQAAGAGRQPHRDPAPRLARHPRPRVAAVAGGDLRPAAHAAAAGPDVAADRRRRPWLAARLRGRPLGHPAATVGVRRDPRRGRGAPRVDDRWRPAALCLLDVWHGGWRAPAVRARWGLAVLLVAGFRGIVDAVRPFGSMFGPGSIARARRRRPVEPGSRSAARSASTRHAGRHAAAISCSATCRRWPAAIPGRCWRVRSARAWALAIPGCRSGSPR